MTQPLSQRSDSTDGRLFLFAVACAAVCLFVAPLRASAGWRGGLLLLAFAAVAVLSWRAADRRAWWPRQLSIGYAIGLWLLSTLAWAVLSADPMSAIGEWKRDIITPLLAFAVFHALTRSVKDLLIWMAALLAGLVLLTILIQVEPFHPLDGNIQTRYGGVGALSTWLVILAALLPMAWHVLSRQAGAWRPVLVFVSVLLLYCAYLTGNRIIWLCFSLMLVAFAAAATRARYPHRLGRYLALALGLAGVALCVMLALSSSHFRFDTEAARADILATASQDPRPRIWRESIDVLKQNAFPGLGYGIDGLKPRLMSRFQDRALAERYGHGHNLMLNYGLQMGVIGITVIVILFAGLAWTFASLGGNGSTGRVAALCGLLMLIGFLTRNMTDDFFHRHSAVLFWAVTGMLLGVTRDDRD